MLQVQYFNSFGKRNVWTKGNSRYLLKTFLKPTCTVKGWHQLPVSHKTVAVWSKSSGVGVTCASVLVVGVGVRSLHEIIRVVGVPRTLRLSYGLSFHRSLKQTNKTHLQSLLLRWERERGEGEKVSLSIPSFSSEAKKSLVLRYKGYNLLLLSSLKFQDILLSKILLYGNRVNIKILKRRMEATLNLAKPLETPPPPHKPTW